MIVVAFAVDAAAHVPGGVPLDGAGAQHDAVRIRVDAAARRSGVAGNRAGGRRRSRACLVCRLHGERGVHRLADALDAGVDYAHAAALAVARGAVSADCAARHGERGVALYVNRARGSAFAKLAAGVVLDFAACHKERGTRILRAIGGVHHYGAALIAVVVGNAAAGHFKMGVAQEHDAGGRKVVAVAIGAGNAVAADAATLQGDMRAVGGKDGAAVHLIDGAFLDNAAVHGKRGSRP